MEDKKLMINMQDKKVQYKDLSMPLKIAIAMSWVIGCIYAFAFLIGLIIGLYGGMV